MAEGPYLLGIDFGTGERGSALDLDRPGRRRGVRGGQELLRSRDRVHE